MRFPESVSAQEPFLVDLPQKLKAVLAESKTLVLPNRLAAGGDFGEEAAALHLVGHMARCLPRGYLGGLGLVSETALTYPDVMVDPLWYASSRLLSSPHSPPLDLQSTLDPRSSKAREHHLADPFADGVRLGHMGPDSFFTHPARPLSYAMALGSLAEARPPGLQVDDRVRPEGRFEELFSSLVERLDVLRHLKPLERDRVSVRWFCEEFAHLTRELYLNATQHGQLTAAGRAIPRAFRAVLVKACDLDLQRLARGDAFTAMLGAFERRTRARIQSRQRGNVWQVPPAVPLLEISIIDNGPGLVRTWLAAQALKETGSLLEPDLTLVSAADEQRMVNECFEKHRTTKSVRGAGIGLFDVHRIMKRLGGIVIVRTSRIRVVQDYSRPPADGGIPRLENWDAQRPALPEISGTCVTLLLPLVPVADAKGDD